MRLSIGEWYYLIALDDVGGKIIPSAEKHLITSIISASIFELHLLKKISLENGEVRVLDTIGVGNITLDNVLKKLKSKVHFIDQVINLSITFNNIVKSLDTILVQKGILRKEKVKLLGISLKEKMDNVDYSFESDIRSSLQSIVFKRAKPSDSLAILFCLLDYNKMLGEVFKDADELDEALQVAPKILERSQLSENLKKSLLEIKKIFV